MPYAEILGLLLLAALFWFWLDSSRAREAGVQAVRSACAGEGLQLLDDTVALDNLRLGRDDEGRLRFRRVYRFEFSPEGETRSQGNVVMLGADVLFLHIDLPATGERHTLQ